MKKINDTIGQDPGSKYLIGVLDIYGFESFKTNRCLAGTLLFPTFICTAHLKGDGKFHFLAMVGSTEKSYTYCLLHTEYLFIWKLLLYLYVGSIHKCSYSAE